jgi:hypothetical protein
MKKRLPDNALRKLSGFVGREREMARVGELLSGHKLLTLMGPGSSGWPYSAGMKTYEEISEIQKPIISHTTLNEHQGSLKASDGAEEAWCMIGWMSGLVGSRDKGAVCFVMRELEWIA